MIVRDKKLIEIIERNKEDCVCWKIMHRLLDSKTGLTKNVSHIYDLNSNSRITYPLNKWVTSSRYCSKFGYYPLVFDNMMNAINFINNMEVFFERNGELKKCEISSIVRTMPPKKDIVYNGNYGNICFNYFNMFSNLSDTFSKWPEGTIMAKYVKIIN